jgi:hypothetical protein
MRRQVGVSAMREPVSRSPLGRPCRACEYAISQSLGHGKTDTQLLDDRFREPCIRGTGSVFVDSSFEFV